MFHFLHLSWQPYTFNVGFEAGAGSLPAFCPFVCLTFCHLGVGLGSVYTETVEWVKNGETIACAEDFAAPKEQTLLCRVSNWGGYAVALGLCKILSQTSHGSTTGGKMLSLNGTSLEREHERFFSIFSPFFFVNKKKRDIKVYGYCTGAVAGSYRFPPGFLTQKRKVL